VTDQNDDHHLQRHYHWEFIAFDGEPVNGVITFGVTVHVVGHETEADALLAARDLVHRETFKLSRVYECPQCGFQKDMAQSMKEMADA
jgi:hypothetical protein